jgi:hypothetical protein
MEMSRMRPIKLNVDKFHGANFFGIAAVAVLFTVCVPIYSMAQEHGQKTFSSPEEASKALVAAAQNNDEKAMIEILGRDAKQIVYSGDEAEDSESRANFVKRYNQMHRLVKEPDGTTVLYIGAENWPTPIPLVNKGKSWYYDTETAKQEILYRRIGKNEMSTIRVCQQLAAAEKEYSSAHNEYARILSDDGQQNGLYWKASNAETQSPVGPLVAAAVVKSSANGQDGGSQGSTPTPYRGYYFRTLTSQGKNAAGGAKNYIVDGKMKDGFAFVAYPAEYRSSGVMTFLVGADGVVYEKDLGKRSDARANGMKEYNPDSTWRKAEEEQGGNAGGQKTQ